MHLNSFGEILKPFVESNPHQLAIVSTTDSIDYLQLDECSEKLAKYMLKIGVEYQDRVAIVVEKEIALFISIFACWKIGAIFVSIDPKSPLERINYLIDDMQPTLMIAPQPMLEKSSIILDNVKIISFEQVVNKEKAIWEQLHHEDLAKSLPQISQNSIAYCMYTSGSTGRPKGVLIEHKSIFAFCNSAKLYMKLDVGARCLNLAAFYFDAVVVDTFYPLFSGATVYLYDSMIIPTTILNIISQEKITHFTAVAPILTMIAESKTLSKFDLSNLEAIWTGADVLHVKSAQEWLKHVHGLRIINGYGPTEATCACMAYVVDVVEPDRTELYPIGMPFPNMKVCLINEEGGVITDNSPGELAISGNQLLREYWNNAEENEKKFIHIGNDRYYLTGDICYLGAKGNYQFIGRNDDEVKILGRRINLNEIRRALLNQNSILDCLVSSVQIEKEKSLVVALTIDDTFKNGEEVLEEIKKHLPSYMIPRHFLFCTSFPKLPSDKIDKRRILEHIERVILDSRKTISFQFNDWDKIN